MLSGFHFVPQDQCNSFLDTANHSRNNTDLKQTNKPTKQENVIKWKPEDNTERISGLIYFQSDVKCLMVLNLQRSVLSGKTGHVKSTLLNSNLSC